MPPGFNFPLRQQREVIRRPSRQIGFWTLSDDDLSGEGRDRQYNATLRLKTDPATYGLVVLLLSFAALMTCWLPARRATKVEPMVAMRQE